MRSYLHYWARSQLHDTNRAAETLEHIASNQLQRVEPGDLVWIVSYENGRLILMGKILVEVVTDQKTAARLLGARPSELWQADWHALARRGTAVRVRTDLDITPQATRLRFEGASPRLPARFSHHHLRSMRTLTADSSALLEALWSESGSAAPGVGEHVDEELAAYEGKLRPLVVQHRLREQKLRRKKLEMVLSEHGALRCEVPGCGFDFSEAYGDVGQGYAHVHHQRPLSARAGEELTTLRELVVVCANCHAMIHRGGACRELKELAPRRRSSARGIPAA